MFRCFPDKALVTGLGVVAYLNGPDIILGMTKEAAPTKSAGLILTNEVNNMYDDARTMLFEFTKELTKRTLQPELRLRN